MVDVRKNSPLLIGEKKMSNQNKTKEEVEMDEILTDVQVAELLNLSPSAIRAWRFKGIGPRWFKLARSVRYLKSDVYEWIAQSRNQDQ